MRNALIAGLLTGMAFVLAHLGIIPSPVEIAIYIVAILLGGYHWSREGIEELIEEKEIGIEILMMAATIGSAILGMWDEAAFLVFLYGTAEGLEEYTYAKTRHSIRKLLDLAPREARVLRNGREITIPAEELKVGDIFVVRPGESMPTDGIIIKGSSSINEAPVTGESIPVEKKEGMKVFAATMNQHGYLEVKATATFENNTLSKIIHLVEEAQEQKGKTQIFIEIWEKVFSNSPSECHSSNRNTSTFWYAHLRMGNKGCRSSGRGSAVRPCYVHTCSHCGRNWKGWQHRCPYKGGIHLENLGNIKVVALDKTGTLTKGTPVVTDIFPLNKEAEVLRLAYSIENLSEHPLARAVVQKAEESGLTPLKAKDFQALTGAGAKAKIDGEDFYIGNPQFFKELGIFDESYSGIIDKFASEGKTVILLGTKTRIYGAIALRDEVRPGTKEIISELHKMGLKVVMLTGDNPQTAKAIANELGIDDFRAGLRPEDKIEAVKELKEKYGDIIMVGDGINDAPALAEATVGIAMGTIGTDAAIEAADVALMADDLSKVPYAISLGKRARRISTQNIIFSLLILAVLIPSALIGIMSVAIAVFVHEASELLAVGNGLRVARG